MSQEGFSGGWPASLRVEEFISVFEIKVTACPLFTIISDSPLTPADSKSIFVDFSLLMLSARISFFLPYIVSSSQSVFNSSIPISISSLLPLAAVDLSFFRPLTCCFFPLLLCEHSSIYSAQDSADLLRSPSCLPSGSTPALLLLPIAQRLFPAPAFSCCGLV